MRRHGWAAACAALALSGCAQKPRPAPPRAESTATETPKPPQPTPATPAPHPPPAPVAPGPQPPPPSPKSAQPAPPEPPAPPSGPRELFPFIRADLAAKVVELDGIVPINCHDPATPNVYLELVACTPDTREHEVLMMTRARPSNVHAALLAIGLKPGAPGSWRFEDKKLIPVPPTGDGVEVSIAYRDVGGREIECPVVDWIINAETGAHFTPRTSGPRWVFAGSVIAKRQGQEVYEADGSGTMIGLCTFGSEVIAWRDTISPEASIQEPVWIADPRKVPAAGTPVVVRIRPSR